MGVGDSISNSKLLDAAVEDLTQITGQKPLVTKAKKSIAVFKLREGMSIGAKDIRGSAGEWRAGGTHFPEYVALPAQHIQ